MKLTFLSKTHATKESKKKKHNKNTKRVILQVENHTGSHELDQMKLHSTVQLPEKTKRKKKKRKAQNKTELHTNLTL